MKKLTLIMIGVALLLGATHAKAQITIQTTQNLVPGSPTQVIYDYYVTGFMVGNFDVGVGSPGWSPPAWGVGPPSNINCGTPWMFTSSTFHLVCPFECPTCMTQQVSLVYRRHDLGGQWYLLDSITVGTMAGRGCCRQPPPQTCNGVWHAGTFNPNPCPDSPWGKKPLQSAP